MYLYALHRNKSSTRTTSNLRKVFQQFSNRLPYKPTSPLTFKLGTSLSFAASIYPQTSPNHPAQPKLAQSYLSCLSTALATVRESRVGFSLLGGKNDGSFFERNFVLNWNFVVCQGLYFVRTIKIDTWDFYSGKFYV